MKKRAYKSTKINHRVQEKLIRVTEGRELIIGIDVAKTEQYAAFRVDGEEVVETVKWNHPKQTTQFVAMLKSLPVKSMDVVLEPTGSYGDAIRHQLLLEGMNVFRMSPKECSDAKELYDGVHSAHDAKSAALIAWLHGVKPGTLWPISSEEDRMFKSYVKQTSHFDEQYHQVLNKLEAELARYWPELNSHLKLTTMTLLELLAEYGGPQMVMQNDKEAMKLMRKIGGSKLAQSKIEQVVVSARQTIGVVQQAAEQDYVKLLGQDALRALKVRNELKKDLEQQAKSIPEVERMGKVVGTITASVLFAKIGAPSSFPNAASFQKSAGLNLKEFSSGKHKGGLHITKRGSGQARQYLYLAALRLLYRDPIAGAWYSKKVQRDGGVKLKAVIALMRKLVRALWHVARGNEFDSSLLFDVRRLSVSATR